MLLLLLSVGLRARKLPLWISILLLCLEIVGLNILIAANGGATNAFSSILLVPLVAALLLLPMLPAGLIVLLSIVGQAGQLLVTNDASHHHGAMLAHAQGMVVSFIATTLLITSVAFILRSQLAQKNKALEQLRERQLRDEQLLAIGTAAAQLTHETASPIQTLRLLLEEQMDNRSSTALQDMEKQIERLENLLIDWRITAQEVREAKLTALSPNELVTGLKHVLALASPESNIEWDHAGSDNSAKLYADRTLLPALSNIVLNAANASQPNGSAIVVTSNNASKGWYLSVRNEATEQGMTKIDQLGNTLVASAEGTGAGAVISNVTIEKFNGMVRWQVQGNQVITSVFIPWCNAT